MWPGFGRKHPKTGPGIVTNTTQTARSRSTGWENPATTQGGLTAPVCTVHPDRPEIIGGWAGRSVSAGAALAVSVTVQTVGVHTGHEYGYRFLRGGQVTTVERVAFQVGDARTVIRGWHPCSGVLVAVVVVTAGAGSAASAASSGQSEMMSLRVSASAVSTLSSHRTLTLIHAAAYQQRCDASGGSQVVGSCAPFERFDPADTPTRNAGNQDR